MNERNVNEHFISLIMMLATACWQQLGKIPNPVTGKIEKDLAHAQVTIDLLVMLRDKTRGNLIPEEDRLMSDTLSDLQLNFADEAGKEGKKEEPKQEEKKEEPTEA